MSASDSDLSEVSKTPAPPDNELEKALRREVVAAQKNEVDFSYKYIRTAAETKLGLTPGFYKNHEDWNQRSKGIIDEQMNIDPEAQSSPPKPKPAAPKKPPAKRKSSKKEPAPKKRQKTVKQDDEQDAPEDSSSPLSDAMSDFEEEAPKKQQRKPPPKPRAAKSKPAKKVKVPASDDEDEVEEEKVTNGAVEADSPNASTEEPNPAENAADASDSELSVLMDEEPAPKKKRKSKDLSDPKTKKPASKASAKVKPDIEDPDQVEIKRLQGWLVKCGIRKLWGKELKPYESPKAKIKHLRDLLSDAGMTGRYSIEKANQIKEARELAADIEAVQEGAERWGAEYEEGGRGDKDADAAARPAPRRLVRGAKNYDFLSSDGEETD